MKNIRNNALIETNPDNKVYQISLVGGVPFSEVYTDDNGFIARYEFTDDFIPVSSDTIVSVTEGIPIEVTNTASFFKLCDYKSVVTDEFGYYDNLVKFSKPMSFHQYLEESIDWECELSDIVNGHVTLYVLYMPKIVELGTLYNVLPDYI